MTDLELMKLLESEGYEANLENLCILKEGIESGEIIIEATREVKEYLKANPAKRAEMRKTNLGIADRARANTKGLTAATHNAKANKKAKEFVSTTYSGNSSQFPHELSSQSIKHRADFVSEKKKGQSAVAISKNRNDYNGEHFSKYLEAYKQRAGARGKTYDDKEMLRRAKASYASSQNYHRKKEAKAKATEEAEMKKKTAGMSPKDKLKTQLRQKRGIIGPADAKSQLIKRTQNPESQKRREEIANANKAKAEEFKKAHTKQIYDPNTAFDSFHECYISVLENAADYELENDKEFILETVIDILTEDGKIFYSLKEKEFLLEMCDFEISDKNVSILDETYIPKISDYNLYKLLESSGYTTTKENLSILKEGLETGKYIIK